MLKKIATIIGALLGVVLIIFMAYLIPVVFATIFGFNADIDENPYLSTVGSILLVITLSVIVYYVDRKKKR